MKMPHIRHLIPSTLLASLFWLFLSMGCTENQQEKGAASHSEDIERIEASSEVEPEVEASAKTVADPDSGEEIVFEFESFRRESGKAMPWGTSQVRVSGDTVFFEVYYSKMVCRGYEYSFRKAGDSLVVLHLDTVMCIKTSGPYAIKGEIQGLRSGSYRFILENRILEKIGFNTAPRVFFQENLVVE